MKAEIEVERQFKLEQTALSLILKNAKFIGTNKMHDVWFDDANFSLTSNDAWLRKRNGKFELKKRSRKDRGKNTRIYEELEDEDLIRIELNLERNSDLEEDLKANGILPFAEYSTTRKKYEKNGITIDVDECSFGYSMIELEIMTGDNETEKKAAEEKILAFAKENRLSAEKIRTKAIEYIFRNNKKHYSELKKLDLID